MDEQPIQLTKEVKTPIEATKSHPKRVDYEYERAGTACIFMFNEPLVGWRNATTRPQRKKTDWAESAKRMGTDGTQWPRGNSTAWRGQYPVPTRPYSDWNYVSLQGRGVYVGDALTVMNPVEK